MSEQKAPIPDGTTHYEGCWKDRRHHTCAMNRIAKLEQENRRQRGENAEYERNFSKRESHWIRENGRLQEENAKLKDKVARLEAPVSRDEWEHHYPTLRLAWEVMTGIIAARAAEPGKEQDNG